MRNKQCTWLKEGTGKVKLLAGSKYGNISRTFTGRFIVYAVRYRARYAQSYN